MGHFSGKIEKDLKKILEISKGRNGKFYEIFNKYGYYDVSDENNGLTPEQRAQVPAENQNRFTQLSNAITEMVGYVLGDSENGILTKSVQSTVDNLDTATQMSNAQLDAVNNGLKGLALTSPVAAGMESVKSIMGAVLGKSYYDVNILPQFTVGIDGFDKLGDLGSAFKPGMIRPNWTFLYDFEKVKSDKFFKADDGTIRIGCNIDVTEGNELYLKKLFSVITVDKTDLSPSGDLKGGVNQNDFAVIQKAAKGAAINNKGEFEDEDIRNFRLNEAQIRASFNNYVEMKLWNIIGNKKNWAYGHWGCLIHNSMPQSVKTAVTSFIWTNGLAIEPKKSEEAALISYLANMGLFYLIGYQYKIKIYGFKSDKNLLFEGDRAMDFYDNETDTDPTTTGELVEFSGDKVVGKLPKNEKIAKRYFIWIADLLTKLTYSSLPSEMAQTMRKRRVAEASLIYEAMGLPKLEYGTSLDKIPYEHSIDGLKNRKFDKLLEGMSAGFWRYKNTGSPGGDPDLKPQDSSAKIYYTSDVTRHADPIVEKYLKDIMTKTGVDSIKITSTTRDAANQARIMFNNLNSNNVIKYRSPGGAEVTQVYFSEKARLGYTRTQPVTNGSHVQTIRAAMEKMINAMGPENISRHCGDPNEINVLDIAPSSITNTSGMFDPRARVKLRNELEKEVQAKKIRKFLHPDNSNDKAFHIEVPMGNGFETSPNDKLPDEKFSISNTNLLKGDIAWMAPLSQDYLDATGKKEEKA